ncbi:Moenomycin biosynthesis protein MoeGT1 [Streptomyces sp. NPDC053048]|uniref:Moenomycin biosynthesis protein MoeGT1 n=1 Tax=Streptomyces sp. NPDC053048 TaxID=3365694 RepID=UPI0037D8C337
MSVPRIHVISPRTWGEFGNYLAATRFARVLEEHLDAEVSLWEAESMLPWVGDIGARIRDITLTSPTPATRTERYLALMDELAKDWPRDVEVAPLAGTERERRLEGMAGHFRKHAPDLVVGTKGFISRLCVAAVRLAGGRVPPVVHQVTNPGLLELPLHRTRHPDLTLVGFDWARTRLIADEGADPRRVRTVGPLVARHDLKGFLTEPVPPHRAPARPAADEPAAEPAVEWGDPAAPERPRLIVFSNRGGEDYLRIVARLAERDADIDLVFVGYGDVETTRRAAALARGGNARRWRFHQRLTQPEYFEYIARAARSPHAFLVSKAGPATTLEAAWFGIPVLMLESGLPMESWVPHLIRDEGLGQCHRSVDDLVAGLAAWLEDPSAIAACKARATAYAGRALDQSATAARIARAVRDVLERS